MKQGTGIGHAQRVVLSSKISRDIRACPFDGKEAQAWTVGFPYERHWLACECGLKSPRRQSLALAIAWWNRRP